ncbi:unnamed protein product [Moneuplotes crassus]|uniref:Uncharacterized protein n=2 Tax=Euplotes crassus TaxID=5936 RepID=A0AAD1Y0V7_EUPCR|nr:unnamed protein product [Moneuplotes crassus]
MKLDRHQHLKANRERIRDWFRLWRHSRAPGYVDHSKDASGREYGFGHSAYVLSKMNDLRMWTITFAPNNAQPLQRVQEMHKINSEFQYIQYRIQWRRVLPLIIGIGFFSRVVFKNTLLNKGEDDVFEMSWRDVYILNK